MLWGTEHICFYNDAFSRSLGPAIIAVRLVRFEARVDGGAQVAFGRECWTMPVLTADMGGGESWAIGEDTSV